MAYFERMRDVLEGQLSEDLLRRRAEAGWQVTSIEWRRELPGDAPQNVPPVEDIPYGLRISEDCQRLEVDPEETRVLMLMMELLVQNFSFTSVASDLNEKGYRTRLGKRWSEISVFEMLPRLIEVGPRMFTTEEWKLRRQHFSQVG
jgi:Recombinase